MAYNGILGLILVHVIVSLIRLVFGPSPIQGIPYNRYLWWLPIGNLIDLGIHFLRKPEVFDWFFRQCIRNNSPIVQLFLPVYSFTKPVIVIADISEIEHIATRRMHEIDRSSLMHDFFKLVAERATIGMKTRIGGTNSGLQPFRQQRRLWNCMLTPRMLDRIVAPTLYRAVERMLNVWELKSQAAPGCAFLADLDLRQAALEGMWETLTGGSLDIYGNVAESIRKSSERDVSIDSKRGTVTFSGTVKYPRFYEALNRMIVCTNWVTTGAIPPLYRLIIERFGIISAARKVKHDVLNNVIDNARARCKEQLHAMIVDIEPSSVLEEVLLRDTEAVNKDTIHLTNEALRDELVELLITGHETTASATGWSLKYLADNQEIQQRLWQSLLAAFPNVPQGILPSVREIMQAHIPYLDAAIAETLRLSSTGPVSFRETLQDCQILGYNIKAGTHLFLMTGDPSYTIKSDDELKAVEDMRSRAAATGSGHPRREYKHSAWPPTVFEPARWLTPDNKFDQHAYPSTPFSTGPRGCFGKKIALLELRLMICMIVLKLHLPKLSPALSKYDSRDLLTRQPIHCYVRPVMRRESMSAVEIAEFN